MVENQGLCPVCGRMVDVIGNRALVKLHRLDGMRCVGSGQHLKAEPTSDGGATRQGRRWGWPLAVAAVATALLIGTLIDSGDETATAFPDASPSPTPKATSTSEAPREDTSLQDAIEAAGLSSALVAELGRVAGDTGYGLTRGTPLTGDAAKSFAVVQIGTCRDLATGYRALDEVIASDVSGGAPATDARTMAAFLRDTFCPAVRPLTQPTRGAQPSGSAPPSDGTRGLMSSVDFLDATFAPGSLIDCATATGQPFGEPHAYALSGGHLLCGDFLTDGPWDPYFIHLDLVFPQPVTAEQALPVITSLLPADIRPDSTREGTNPPYSPPGGCLSIVWSSPTLSAAVERVNSGWEGGTGASAILYSDRQTSDGSSSPFDGTVRVAAIGIGGHNVGSTDSVTC
jgi:hypothetical protein